MARLDIGRLCDTGEIDALVAFAQGCAELIQSCELAVAKLDPEARGALNQSAHVKFPKPARSIRII
jgi:hypothetical protein